jgi:hypothetical protein
MKLFLVLRAHPLLDYVRTGTDADRKKTGLFIDSLEKHMFDQNLLL